jgi:hypothetical protein
VLKVINDYINLKKEFASKFGETLDRNLQFKFFCYELFTLGTAYIVGGYIRDVSLKQKSRDLDMVIHLPNHILIKILEESKLDFKINRLQGIKINLIDFQVDLWSIENNWAFKNNVVEKNDDNILESIANGCFFNYDALVINIHTNNLNVRHFNDMVESNKLDIIQKNLVYKKLNPTIEANILRAFFLKEKYSLDYSENCFEYLISRLGYLDSQFGSALKRLEEIIIKYPKYQELLTSNKIQEYIIFCTNSYKQSSLDFSLGFS